MPLLSSEFPINTTTSDTQKQVDMAVLASGQFVVVWTDTSNAGNAMIGVDVRAQIFNADGSKSGAEFIVNSEVVTQANWDQHLHERPAVTALSNGGFAVTYLDSRASTNSNIFNTTVMQRFDASGNKVGTDSTVFPVSDTNGSPIFANTSDLLGLGNGNIVTVAASTTTSTTFLPADNGGKIAMALTSAGGASISTNIGNVTFMGDQKHGKLALLSDGNYALVYSCPNPTAFGSTSFKDVRIAVYTETGALAMPEVVISMSNYIDDSFPPQIAALGNGKFVVTWVRSPTSAEFTANGWASDIYAQIVNADGSMSGGNIAVHGNDAIYQRAPAIAGKADGSFIVVWQESNAFGQPGTLRAQLFNANGTPNGTALTLSAASLDSDKDPEVIALEDGRYFVSWEDGDGNLGDPSSAIHGQFIDPRTAAVNWTGTSKADQFVGTDFNDRLKGGAGADKLWGGAGNDMFLLGSGADEMSGGDGNDTYYVDAIDIVYEAAGGGTDRIWASSDFTLAAGVEIEFLYAQNNVTASPKVLTGNELGNRIFGGTQSDSLKGVAGADTLDGKAGNDRLEGGSGIDRIAGGTGADTIVLGNLAADRDIVSDFEHGVEDFEINATLFGGGLAAGALSSAQFEINTTGQAGSSSARFIYNSNTGALYFDANGDATGQRVLIATLTNKEVIDEADFILV